jgi:hypothetical protein
MTSETASHTAGRPANMPFGGLDADYHAVHEFGDRPDVCQRCGEECEGANVEAFELSGELVCDDCAEAIFEDNSQFGVGA